MSPLQAIGDEAGPAIGAFLKANSGTGAPLGVLDPDPIAAAQKLMALTEQVVKHFVSTIWYLKQASALMTTQDQLRRFPGGTDSGPGRIDDFRLAQTSSPATSCWAGRRPRRRAIPRSGAATA